MMREISHPVEVIFVDSSWVSDMKIVSVDD
jgi:hypothetical protein